MEDVADDDVVVRELQVCMCNIPSTGVQLCVLSHPLRPPWRPYEYAATDSVRYKPTAKRLEADVPLDTKSINWDDGLHEQVHLQDEEAEDVELGGQGSASRRAAINAFNYKQIDHITLRSQQVEQNAQLCVGAVDGDKLLLLPVDLVLQMRPDLSHLNVTKKGEEGGGAGGEGGGDEEAEEADVNALRAVEVQVQKRETERQQQARLNSYAYLANKEAEEAWKSLKLFHDDSPAATQVWERMTAVDASRPPVRALSRAEYLCQFSPALCASSAPPPTAGSALQPAEQQPLAPPLLAPDLLEHLLPVMQQQQQGPGQPQADAAAKAQAGASGAGGKGGGGGGAAASQPGAAAAAAAATAASLSMLSEATRTAFTAAIQALFAKYSVCSLRDVRQWLLEPKNHTSEASKAAALKARDAAHLEDRQLNELVLSGSGLQLTCLKQLYVLKQTGRADTDAFRRVVLDLLADRDQFRKQEVLDQAKVLNVSVTDTVYSKVLKELCVNRNNTWSLKHGADLPY